MPKRRTQLLHADYMKGGGWPKENDFPSWWYRILVWIACDEAAEKHKAKARSFDIEDEIENWEQIVAEAIFGKRTRKMVKEDSYYTMF